MRDDASSQFDQLSQLIKHGDVIGLRHAFEAGANPNMRNRFGWTLLMLAASEPNGALATQLLAAGADVNAINDFGASPLAYAALAGSHTLVELLLRAGASYDAKPHGVSIIQFANSGGHSNARVFDMLAEAERNRVSR